MFGAPITDLKKLYLYFIRSHCKQSSSVWHSGLTDQNKKDIERIQKMAFKIILKENCRTYQHALNILQLETLEDRRKSLRLTFATKGLSIQKLNMDSPLIIELIK